MVTMSSAIQVSYSTISYRSVNLPSSIETGGYIMLGRSDGVLNPNGVRFGSAELYAILTHFIPDVLSDAIAIGQQWGADEHVLLFLQQSQIDADFESTKLQVIQQIRQELSPKHVPAYILPVKAIPYTMNGKKAEVVLKKLFNHNKSRLKGESAIQEITNANSIGADPIFEDKQLIGNLAKGLQDPAVLDEYLAIKHHLLD
jgi:acetoacetyl-CoA synthetase